MAEGVSSAVRAFAAGDLSSVADCFAHADFDVQRPACGILQLCAPDRMPKRIRLLLSVGIHGDETAPIELLAQLLDELAGTPQALALDLMVVVGNPAAIAQGRRHVDADLNRMFCAARGALQSAVEAVRADEIMRATASFFGAVDADKWHLDLHTAIRPSHFPTFAVVPGTLAGAGEQRLLSWLGNTGIHAVILNDKPAPTFSAWTAQTFNAASATLELGRIGPLGTNDLRPFADARSALDAFLRCGKPPAAERTPQIFKVAQELIKHDERFRMAFDRDTWNFTPLQAGALIAADGDVVYRVGSATEYVVFPNPDVRPGLRAGLMVVPA
jgi:succinylglutamate desuccinylase